MKPATATAQVYVYVEENERSAILTPTDNYKRISLDDAIKFLMDVRRDELLLQKEHQYEQEKGERSE